MTPPSLLHRLKERKLVQWAVAYLAGAFVVFQGVEVAAEPWGISPGVQRAVHVLLFIGLFVTLVLAWYHGDKGRQEVSGPELLMVASLLLMAGVALSVVGPWEGDSAGRLGTGGVEATGPGADQQAGVVEDSRPSIAVLPFDDYSPDPNDAYFADGMQEQLTLTLSRIRSLGVKGRTSTMRYREDPKPLPELAEELGVTFVLEGSARIAGGQVSVTVQLVDAVRDEHIWADEYDREFSPEIIVALHREVAEQVAAEVRAVLTPQDRARLASRQTASSEAYQEYLKGRFHWASRSEEGLSAAIAHFQRAIELDSTYAQAYSGLADCYAVLPFYFGSVEPRVAFARGLDAAQAAVRLAPDMAEAHASLGYLRLLQDREWEVAERELRMAIDLDPSYPTAHHWLADLLWYSGRFEEAAAGERRALELDPLSFISNYTLGQIYYSSRRMEAALDQYEQTVRLYPNNFLGWAVLAETRYMNGDFEAAAEADSVATFLFGLSPSQSAQLVRLATEFHGTGTPGTLPPGFDSVGAYTPTGRARLAAMVGDSAKALEWLEVAVEGNWPSVLAMAVSPLWDPYRANPRFQDLMEAYAGKDPSE